MIFGDAHHFIGGNMNKIINSPIVVAIFVVASLFILKAQTKPKVANEIRSAYEELMAIAEEAGTDGEKTKAIQSFAEEIGTQLREGFQAGFKSPDKEKKESREAKFLRTRESLLLSEAKEIKSSSSNSQQFLFTITNNLDLPVKQLKVNCEFYNGGNLIDVKNEWISEIKALAPKESIAIKKSRNLPRNAEPTEAEANKFDQVKLTVTSFELIEDQ